MNELSLKIIKYNIDLLVLQELRWCRQKLIHKKDYTLYYSGPEKKTGRYGVGFCISKKMNKFFLKL